MKRFPFFLLLILTLTPHALARPIYVNFYVATNGNDAWSGVLPAPNAKRTDGPFATLPRAVIAAKTVDRNRMNFAAVRIYLRGGVYPLAETVTIADTGRLEISGYQSERARLMGGKEIDGWKTVTDEAVLSRMDAACRGKVMQADLKANGIAETGAIVPNGWNPGSRVPGPSELIFDDRPMTIARWPNAGYEHIADVPKVGGNSHFQYSGDRPTRWKNADDGWIFGYWQFDWADSYVRLKSVDAASHTIETGGVTDEFGARKGQRWYALNLLEELDSPGEYYIDRRAGIIYFWPPAPLAMGKTYLSLLAAPLIALNHTSGVTISGLTFENTRGEGVHIESIPQGVFSGHGNLVAGCVFRNMGLQGVRIASGTDNFVQSCDFYNMGQGAIALDGGNRLTLTMGNNQAYNNLIHNYSNWVRCYRPAINVEGVGQGVSNNLIYDGPHNAILLSGNEHLIAGNEIHHVCQDTGDVGAFYMGRDWTMRGNKIVGNYFHHLGGFSGQGFTDAMGVYLDDAASGAFINGNVFYKAGRAVMIGGGRDNVVTNNRFVECSPSIHVDARGTSWAKDYIKKGGDWQMYEKLQAVHYDSPPYSVKYPALASILTDAPDLPKGTRIEGNSAFGGKWTELQDGLTEATAGFRGNTFQPNNPYAGLSDRELLRRVLKDADKYVPANWKIGVQIDSYRKTLPAELVFEL